MSHLLQTCLKPLTISSSLFMLLVLLSSTVLWRILETLGEIALISALCMFSKPLERPGHSHVGSRSNDCLLFLSCFFFFHTSSSFPCICWNLISLCSVTKALKPKIQSRKRDCSQLHRFKFPSHFLVLFLLHILYRSHTFAILSEHFVLQRGWSVQLL